MWVRHNKKLPNFKKITHDNILIPLQWLHQLMYSVSGHKGISKSILYHGLVGEFLLATFSCVWMSLNLKVSLKRLVKFL
jgi:hypothetical protein